MHSFNVDGMVGHIDQLTAGCLEGWAWRPEQPGRPVTVQLVLDGWVARSVEATCYRDDLEKAGIGSGRHGFVLPILPQDMATRPAMLKASVDHVLLEGFSIPINHVNVVDIDSLPQLLFGQVLAHGRPWDWRA